VSDPDPISETGEEDLTAPADPGGDRAPGTAKGLFVVPDDFDAPLDDFRDYM
jgi:hypothetical protein